MINACKEELNKNGIYLLSPKGNSMRPFIKHGRKVIVEPKTERLKLYDVGLYERPDKTLVLHRVIEVLDDGYVFVGDSTIDTEIVPEYAVFAVMLAFIKGKRRTVDANSERYLSKVKKYYSNLKRREKIIKRLNRKASVKARIKRFFSKKGR